MNRREGRQRRVGARGLQRRSGGAGSGTWTRGRGGAGRGAGAPRAEGCRVGARGLQRRAQMTVHGKDYWDVAGARVKGTGADQWLQRPV